MSAPIAASCCGVTCGTHIHMVTPSAHLRPYSRTFVFQSAAKPSTCGKPPVAGTTPM
jgi:hypothetical protein